MIDPQTLEKLRDLPIEGVAQRLGMELSYHRTLCPFHADKHPSLSFHRTRNTYRCYVCGAHGGTIDLVMKLLHKDFRAACQWLADEHNLIIEQSQKQQDGGSWQQGGGGQPSGFDPQRYARFFEHPWLSPAAQRFLFDERRLDPRVIQWCRLTSWRDRQGTDWLQIPYFDPDGHLIGVQNRRLSPAPSAPRFRFPPGSRTSIYNLPILRHLKPHDECWIAEGSSDCWSLMSDHRKALAIASATLLQPKDKELLLQLTRQLSIHWFMAPDQDEPGRSLAAQLQQLLPDLQIVPLPPGFKDYSELHMQLTRPA